MLPPDQSDLEILEQLRKSVMDGQHDFYRAVPQLAVVAGMYLGPAAPEQRKVVSEPPQPDSAADSAAHVEKTVDNANQVSPVQPAPAMVPRVANTTDSDMKPISDVSEDVSLPPQSATEVAEQPPRSPSAAANHWPDPISQEATKPAFDVKKDSSSPGWQSQHRQCPYPNDGPPRLAGPRGSRYSDRDRDRDRDYYDRQRQRLRCLRSTGPRQGQTCQLPLPRGQIHTRLSASACRTPSTLIHDSTGTLPGSLSPGTISLSSISRTS